MDATPFDDLLGHARFARGLARALLSDEHLAEDAVQETWLAAVRRPPRLLSAAWIGTVARNAALKMRRGESRRAAREAAVARPDEAAAFWRPEQQAILREVVDAVLALDEPYRSTVLLRFYEDAPPREIAARQGVSVNTVNSRLQRALVELRARLDKDRGGREATAGALFVLAGRPATPAPVAPKTGGAALAAGSALVGIKAKLVAAAVLLVLAGAAAWEWSGAGDVSPHAQPTPMAASPAPRPGPEAPALRRRGDRTTEETSLAPTVSESDGRHEPAETSANAIVKGVAVLPAGFEGGFAYVTAESDGERRVLARADLGPGGTFLIEIPAEVVKDGLDAEVGACVPGLVRDVQKTRLQRGKTSPIALRLARGLRISGSVVTVDGTPVLDLPLLVQPMERAPTLVSDDLLDTDRLLAQTFDPAVQWATTTTDGAGRFAVEGLAPGGYGFLTSTASWILRTDGPVAAGTEDARVVARPARSLVLHVKGAGSDRPLTGCSATLWFTQALDNTITTTSWNRVLPRGELRLRWDQDATTMFGDRAAVAGGAPAKISATLGVRADGHHERALPLALDGAAVTLLDVELAPVDEATLGTLRIEAVDAHGEPVAYELDARLVGSAGRGGSPSTLRFSRSDVGRFVLSASPGAWTLTLTANDCALGDVAVTHDVELVAGGAADLRLALPPSGFLEVRRPARDGDLPRLVVSMSDAGGNSLVTDMRQLSQRWRVAPGTWKVTVGEGPAAKVREVVVRASEEAVVEVEE